jgi:hypothetical protein
LLHTVKELLASSKCDSHKRKITIVIVASNKTGSPTAQHLRTEPAFMLLGLAFMFRERPSSNMLSRIPRIRYACNKVMKRLSEILEEPKTSRAPARGARATRRKSAVSGTLVGGCP